MDPGRPADRITDDPGSMTELLGDIGIMVRFLDDAIELYEERGEFPILEFAPEEAPIELIMAGDDHGDLFIAKKVVSHFLKEREEGKDAKLLFLGDIIDRPPDDVPYGSLLTLVYLISFKMKYPDSVFLLRGNHECHHIEPFFPHELPGEVREMYGDENEDIVVTKVHELFSRLPLMARTGNGLFASHAGFPFSFRGDLRDIKNDDYDTIVRTTWGDPRETGSYRGLMSRFSNFDEREFTNFMERAGCRIFIRGHLPILNGKTLYDDRLLTIFTSRRYEESGAGGILLAEVEVPPGEGTVSMKDVRVRTIS